MHIEQKPMASTMTQLKKIDWVGCILLSASLTLILMSISWVCTLSPVAKLSLHLLQGGIMYSWGSWRTILPLVLGIVILFGWVVYSYSGIKSDPMIPLVVLNDRTAAISYFGNLVHGLAVRTIQE